MNHKILFILASLVLSACGNDNATENADNGRSAEGEVLGGSISDDMLPLDTLKSQSPPLKVQSTGVVTDSTEAESTEDDAIEDTAGPEAGEAPAENPVEQDD